MKIGIVLQARMGSTRLPGKTLMEFLGQPLIHYVIERLRRVEGCGPLVLAAPDTEADRVLEEVARREGVQFWAGPEDDVLGRYWGAAEAFGLDHIVRATADNPLVDAAEARRLVAFHLEEGCEYSENFTVLPKGVGVEIFSREGLRRCERLSRLPHQREGVHDLILENPGLFRRGTLERRPFKPTEADLTVDTWEQFERMARLYGALYRPGHPVDVASALAFVEAEERHRV